METILSVCSFCWWRAREGCPGLYSWIWVDSWQQKWMNPFPMCEAGLMVGSQLRYWGRIWSWFTELNSPSPCGTGIQTGTPHQASGWHIKSRSRTILRANPWTIIRHPCDPTLPSLIRARRVRQHTTEDEGNILEKKKGYQRIRHGFEKNWTNQHGK